MFNKTILATAVAAGIFAAVAPFASAERGEMGTTTPKMHMSTTTAAANVAAKIACVGAAVHTREAAVGAGITAYTSAVNTAYTARAAALDTAYTQTTLKGAAEAVKAAWSTFKSSSKTARKAWKSTRDAAWKAYRTAAVACKAPPGVGDGVNSELETMGD